MGSMPPDAPVFEDRFWLARVWADGESRSQLIGTAFAISSSHLLTSAHVVNEAGGSGPGDRVYRGLPPSGDKGKLAGPQLRSPPRSSLPLRLITAGQRRLLRPSRACFVASASIGYANHLSFNRFHPILDLRLHEFDGSNRGGNLKDVPPE